jgi:hypothetical protein
MLEEESEEVRSYHACMRRDCTRVYRESSGYADWIEGEFNQSRPSAQQCPRCGANLYLAAVNRLYKVETWECPQTGCEFSEDIPSPSAR